LGVFKSSRFFVSPCIYWMFSAKEGSAGEIGRSFRQIGPTDLFKFPFKFAPARVFTVAGDHNHFSITAD